MDEDIRGSCSPQKSPAEYFQIALDAIRKITGVDITSDQEALLFIEAGKIQDLSGEWDEALESSLGYVGRDLEERDSGKQHQVGKGNAEQGQELLVQRGVHE